MSLEERSGPTLIAVTTPTCHNCRAMAPILEQTARDFVEIVDVVKIDASADPDTAARLAVRGVPTYIARQGPREVARRTGRMAPAELRELFESAASGHGIRRRISPSDRSLRLLVAAIFGVAGLVTGTPLFVVLGVAAAAFGVWDLVLPDSDGGDRA